MEKNPKENNNKKNQEWKNEHFNMTSDNKALAIETELQNEEKVILATIYCPNGNLIDFLVGRVIKAKIEGFLFPKVYLKAGVPQGSNVSPLLFLSMSKTCQILVTTRVTSRNLQMTPANRRQVKISI